MKSLCFATFVLLIFVSSCSQKTKNPNSDSTAYGKLFDKSNAINVSDALASWKSYKDKGEITLTGTCAAVCQTEGCWFKYNTEPEQLFVDFDHVFIIAKDCKDKTLYAHGHFYQDTVSLEMLQEYAKDDGKSEEEINAIKNPKIELHFRASGVDID